MSLRISKSNKWSNYYFSIYGNTHLLLIPLVCQAHLMIHTVAFLIENCCWNVIDMAIQVTTLKQVMCTLLKVSVVEHLRLIWGIGYFDDFKLPLWWTCHGFHHVIHHL